jgi:hypothetical protein
MMANLNPDDTDALPLPPDDITQEMMATADVPAKTSRPAVALQFKGIRSQIVALEFPFEYDGRLVAEIVVRRLNTAELGAIVDRLGADFTQWDLFAAMTGMPVDVLRGLDCVDGAEVTEVAHAFLPRRLRG